MISTVEKVLFLKGQNLFSQIPSEDLATIAQITDEVHYEEGDDIVREGEPGDALYLIVSGEVRVHQGGEDVAKLTERQIVGEMSLLDSEPRSASVSALTDLTLLRISRDDFNEILGEKVEIALGIIKVLTQRQRDTMRQLGQAKRELADVQRKNGVSDAA